MAIIIDQDISGAGLVSLGPTLTQISFWTVHLTTLGPEVRPLEASSPDHILRAGWVAMGNFLSQGQQAAGGYWLAPTWLDFDHSYWAPDSDLRAFWTHIRWCLTTGTLGHLQVTTP
jgi:hypothetical protein